VSKLRVHNLVVSLDGFATGEGQSLEAAFGHAQQINEFLQADLVDYLHIVQVPIVLGRGVRLWDGLDGLHERYTLETVTVPSGATHLFFTR
jgi:hypothetical protein